ncbi:MAG TPA: hypothetical protein PKI59_01530 [Candidatus Cloacimonadota bacterium]|nr:hypothetical protein [Candidatus Cloacimonadota bacterium]
MLKTLLKLCALILILLASACEMNRLASAEDLYHRKKYAGAIEELDKLIRIGKNGAIVTRAELVRSNSYLELGKLAIERKNWNLATRFFKLANSEASDVELGKMYMLLGMEAYSAGNMVLAKSYMDNILREIPNSNLIPEVLLRRISIFMNEYQDRNAAWEDYTRLYDNYPNNSYEISARSYIMQFIRTKIDYARRLIDGNYYTDALKELFELSKYPVVSADEINAMISDVYQAQAEEYIEDQDYLEADRMFKIAIQYYPAKKAEISQRLESITSLYVQKGNSLLQDRDFEAALLHYNKTFEIIPDYPPALAAIQRLNQIKENISKAAQLYSEGETQETQQKYADALRLYNQAIALDDRPEYRNRAAQMQNLIEATKNPTAFAQRIINEYRGGILINRVASKRAELLLQYKPHELRDSGWKILLSTGQFKYEARYDLLSPNETFLYVWQVNLRDRTLIPLNKLSEALMQ